jgi:uncharacterized protein (DUF2147 family)
MIVDADGASKTTDRSLYVGSSSTANDWHRKVERILRRRHMHHQGSRSPYFDCQLSVCGQIAGIKDATRRPSQCGMTIIWGLKARGGSTEWTAGSILDPNDGKTY